MAQELPQWVLDIKKKGQEVKVSNGHYYLYDVRSSYVKGEKNRRKESTYLGKLVEGVGLVPKGRTEDAIRGSSGKVELEDHASFGVGASAPVLMREEIEGLARMFPEDWQSIFAFAYNRLVHHCPIKDMKEHWDRTFLKTELRGARMSEDALPGMLERVGRSRESCAGFFASFRRDWDCVVFDGTDGESQSGNVTYTRLQKMKSGGWGMVYNIMMVFSVGDSMPGFYKVFRGNIKDVKSFLMTLRESGYSNVIIIADKGFTSEANLKELDGLGMNYILPLRRNSSKIDYGPTRDSRLGEGGTAFTYNGRTVFGYRRDLDDGHYVDLFLDANLREEEARGYRERIQKKEAGEEWDSRGPEAPGEGDEAERPCRDMYGEPYEVSPDWEKYGRAYERMGTIAFVVPKAMEKALRKERDRAREEERRKAESEGRPAPGPKQPDDGKDIMTPSFVYRHYKFRSEVEDEIEVYKNFLEADRTYMRSDEALEGWVFCNMVALRWYYRIANRLRETGLSSRYSVPTAISFLREVEKGKVNGKWEAFPLSKAEEKVFKALGLDINQEFVFPKETRI